MLLLGVSFPLSFLIKKWNVVYRLGIKFIVNHDKDLKRYAFWKQKKKGIPNNLLIKFFNTQFGRTKISRRIGKIENLF